MRQKMFMRLAVVLMSAALFAVPAAAAAPSVEEAFKQFDLFGQWAQDCKQPATPDNPHVNIVMSSPGVVLEWHDIGADNEGNRYSVLAAEPVSASRLSVEVIFRPGVPGEERQKLVFQIRNGTRRTIFNQPDGGAVRVKGGIVLDAGVKTPVLRKCE